MEREREEPFPQEAVKVPAPFYAIELFHCEEGQNKVLVEAWAVVAQKCPSLVE